MSHLHHDHGRLLVIKDHVRQEIKYNYLRKHFSLCKDFFKIVSLGKLY